MKEFIELFEEALELEDGAITKTTEFRILDEWSSLAVMSVNAMINEEFDIVIPRNEFEKLITVEDLYNYILNLPILLN